IRETSQAVTYCTGHLPKTAGDPLRMVRQRRLFRWRTYDATQFEDFTTGKREELPVLCNDWHWGPGSPAFQVFDTFDAVAMVGTVTETGSCYRCGGTRRRPSCSCSDNHAPETGKRKAAAPAGPRRGAGGAADAEPAPVVGADQDTS